jgi:uncharacterized repeat protein (TIGR01451 family)
MLCVLLATLASLTFFAGEADAAALSFSTSFAATSIPTGATTKLTFAIRNPNPIGVTNIAFSDSLPAGLVVANPSNVDDNGCGGTVTADPGTATINFSGGSLTSGELCLISLDVEGTDSGVKNNVTSNITSSNGTDGTASASIVVDSSSAQFVEGFGADSIPLGGTTALTFKLRNPYATTMLTGVGFTNTLQAGLVVATPNGQSGTCGGGSITAPVGSSSISLAGATLAPGASCTFSVIVSGVWAGDWTSQAFVDADQGVQGDTASAELSVGPSRRPDPSFVTNGEVDTIARANGRIYIGGAFSEVGPRTGPWASVSAASGQFNAGMPQVSGGAGRVDAIVHDGAGGFYIGGDFTHVGQTARNNAAHILADGTVDPGWDPNPNSVVVALAVSGSTLYMGGGFTTVNGTVRRFAAAAVSATTGDALAWDPEPGGAVLALAVSGSTVYMGGNFTSVNDSVDGTTTRHYAAAVDSTTGVATGWQPVGENGTPLNAEVNALTVSGSTVYIGGDFTYCCASDGYLAAVDATSGASVKWAEAVNGPVEALAVSSSTVYAGGYFGEVEGQNGGVSGEHVAEIGTDGVASSWDPKVTATVRALAVSGSTVYIGGDFSGSGSVNGSLTRNGLAALDAATGTATAWDPNANGSVDSLALSGSTVATGGSFSSLGGQTRRDAAALSAADGTLTAWDPDPNGFVRALAVSGSTVYMAGDFDLVNGVLSRSGAAAVDATTGLAQIWDPSIDDGAVETLAISGSTVYLGGSFTHVNGLLATVRNGAAAFDATVGQATAWNPNVNGDVRTLAVAGSTVYLGGQFSSVNGTLTRNNAAAVDTTSGVADGWNPNVSGLVDALAVSGSTVYLGGWFSGTDAVNGTLIRNHAAAVDAATGVANVWNPDVGGPVDALAVSGSTVFLGGLFNGPGSLNGSLPRDYLAAVDSTTGTATAFDGSPTGNGVSLGRIPNCCSIESLLPDGAGGVIAGGQFATFDRDAQANLASFGVPPANTVPPSISGTPTVGQTLSCSTGTWSGTPPVFTYQWLRDGAPITSATAATYAVTVPDAGHDVGCRVTATNLSGHASATSAAAAIPSVGSTIDTLTVSKSGAGSGTITSSPSGISCGTVCSHGYGHGTEVTLTAAPAGGSAFTGWSGACTGTSTCVVTTNVDATVTAAFSLVPKACVVPKVKGKTVKRAKRSIKAHHCTVGKIKRVTSRRVKRGHVISQKPNPGRRLHHGARVNLVVSKGKG